MKTVLILAFLVVAVTCAPQKPSEARILRYDNDNIGLGGYSFGYDTSDGISRQESAQLKNAGSEQEALAVKGSFTWFGADGKQYTINYIADENGFQPQGAHLPQ